MRVGRYARLPPRLVHKSDEIVAPVVDVTERQSNSRTASAGKEFAIGARNDDLGLGVAAVDADDVLSHARHACGKRQFH